MVLQVVGTKKPSFVGFLRLDQFRFGKKRRDTPWNHLQEAKQTTLDGDPDADPRGTLHRHCLMLLCSSSFYSTMRAISKRLCGLPKMTFGDFWEIL